MKKLLSMVAVAALLITGCAKELKVTTAENLKVEYGEELDIQNYLMQKSLMRM